jgi:hypothetical protein
VWREGKSRNKVSRVIICFAMLFRLGMFAQSPFQLMKLDWLPFTVHYLNFFIVVLGYIVAFTKDLTICHISYFNSLPPSFSFISPYLHSNNSFNRYHFSIYIHVYTIFCTIFTLLPPFTAISPLPLPLVPSHPGQDLFRPLVL